MAIGFIERYVAVDINGANALPQHVVEGIAFVGKNGVVEDGALLKYKLANMAAIAVNKTSNAVTIRTPFENPMYVENALYSDVPFEQFGNVDEWHVAEGYTFTSADGFKATGKIPVYDYTSIEAEYQEETDEGFIFMGSAGSGVLVEDEINLAVKKEKFGNAEPREVRAGFRFTSAFGVDEEGTMPTVSAATPYFSIVATDDSEESEIQVRSIVKQEEGYVSQNSKYSEVFVRMDIDGNKVTMYCGDVSVKKKVADVIGNSDADKNIILDGELPNGVYTVLRQTSKGLVTVGTFTSGITYTNLVPISEGTTAGVIYNGTGYKDNTRLSSSGGESGSPQANSAITGFMPFKNTDVISMKGAEWLEATTKYGGHWYFNLYDANRNFITGGGVSASDYSASEGVRSQISITYDSATGITTFQIIDPDGATGSFRAAAKKAAYFRINAYGKGADLIITRNEEIV